MMRTLLGVGLAICVGLVGAASGDPVWKPSPPASPAPAAADAQRAFDEGVRHMQAKRYREAGEAFQRAIQARPDFAEAHSNLGFALRNTGRLDEAIGQYQEAIRLKPDLGEAYEYLGGAYLMKGDKQAALEQHRILERLNPRLAAELMEEIEKAR